MTLYAKSDGTTLLDHTNHVVLAVKKIADNVQPALTIEEKHITVNGAILHDLGKGHPHFQASLKPDFDARKDRFAVPHRHELSSLLFLPLFAAQDWEPLIDMVVAHHKSLRVIKDKKGRGLLDLLDDYDVQEVFDRHAEDWHIWHPLTFSILEHYHLTVREIPLSEAKAAFDRVISHCESHRVGRNQWRGLLMAADHLASALQEDTETRVERLFHPPDLSAFEARAQEADESLFPLSKKKIDSPKKHTLVIAPTGAGKTDYLLRRSPGNRVFYLLPFQASINAMYLRMERTINGTETERLPLEAQTDIRRIHAAAQIEIDDLIEEETLLQRHPGAALKVMTPHQIAALVFGLAGHEAVALDIAGQHVILDEIHVYNEQTQAMVMALVSSLVSLDCHVHIGSATIPTALKEELIERLGGLENVEIVRLTPDELATYDRHRVHCLPDEAAAREAVAQAINSGKRVLFISNRVADAQERFRWGRENFPDLPLLLVHSRFRRKDRAFIEKQIEQFEENQHPCLVVSTQVIEVSLDISYDSMITDCAPLDSLVQRFGRVNRRRKHAGQRTIADVYVLAPPDNASSAKPYSLEILKRTWENLKDGEILTENSLQARIDKVYPTIEIKKIEVHLIEQKGEIILQQLCNLPRSELIESLEIETATVVCESDAEAYRLSKGEARQSLEIPVSPQSLRSKFKTWRQIKVGHYPFVCPDVCYEEIIGFRLEGDAKPPCIFL